MTGGSHAALTFAWPFGSTELSQRKRRLTQMNESEKRLLEAAEFAPAGVAGPAVFVQQPGDMLNQLVRDIEHGRIRNQQGLFGRRCDEWNHHANDEGPCHVTIPADLPISPSSTGWKEVQCPVLAGRPRRRDRAAFPALVLTRVEPGRAGQCRPQMQSAPRHYARNQNELAVKTRRFFRRRQSQPYVVTAYFKAPHARYILNE